MGREDLSVGGCQVAHASEFVRALRDQLLEMTRQLAWIERQDVTSRTGRACAMRIEAAALRRDINEAQILIDRLQRRYPLRRRTRASARAGAIPSCSVNRSCLR